MIGQCFQINFYGIVLVFVKIFVAFIKKYQIIFWMCIYMYAIQCITSSNNYQIIVNIVSTL